MDHLGQDRETHGQRQSTIAQHGNLLHSDATAPQCTAEIREEDPAGYAADILVRPNLMTWNAAVHYTQVDPNTVMVRCTAPWLSGLFGCLDTAGRSAARVSAPRVWLGSKEFTGQSSVESTCWL